MNRPSIQQPNPLAVPAVIATIVCAAFVASSCSDETQQDDFGPAEIHEPGTQCDPTSEHVGCNNPASGLSTQVDCDATSQTWVVAGTCLAGEYCVIEPADPADPTGAKKTRCVVKPNSGGGGGDAGSGSVADAATDTGPPPSIQVRIGGQNIKEFATSEWSFEATSSDGSSTQEARVRVINVGAGDLLLSAVTWGGENDDMTLTWSDTPPESWPYVVPGYADELLYVRYTPARGSPDLASATLTFIHNDAAEAGKTSLVFKVK